MKIQEVEAQNLEFLKRYKKMKNKGNKLFKITFALSIFLFTSSVICKLYLCSSLAIKNSELEEAFTYRKQLEEQISKLSFENSNLSSIDLVEKKAKSMGFVEMTEKLLSINPGAPIQVAVLKR